MEGLSSGLGDHGRYPAKILVKFALALNSRLCRFRNRFLLFRDRLAKLFRISLNLE